jgi:hypothetical protein
MEAQILCFKAIVSFVADLHDVFHASQPIKLYYAVLQQITFTKTLAIEKNVKFFAEFYEKYRDDILSRNKENLRGARIGCSKKAYIDFDYVIANSDDSQMECIWQHLLTIAAIIDPASRAKALLQNINAIADDESKNILGNIMEKIEKHVDASEPANPVEMISKIIQSGDFADIVADISSSLSKGNLDLGNLMSSAGLNIGNLGIDLPTINDSSAE